jgi:hypothetical protein
MEHDTKAPDSPAVAGLVERTVGRLEPERADGSEHYWDDRDEPFDEPTPSGFHTP